MFIIENVALTVEDSSPSILITAPESIFDLQQKRQTLPAIEGFFGKSKAEKLNEAVAIFKEWWKEIIAHRQTANEDLVISCNKTIEWMHQDLPGITRRLKALTPERLAKVKLVDTLHYVDTAVGLTGSVELPELAQHVLSLTPEALLKTDDLLVSALRNPSPAVKRAFTYGWDDEAMEVTLLPSYHYEKGPSFHKSGAVELGYTVQNVRGLLADIEKAIDANKKLCAMLPTLMKLYHEFGEVCVNKIFIGGAPVYYTHYTARLTRCIAPIWKNAMEYSLRGYATHALTIVKDIAHSK